MAPQMGFWTWIMLLSFSASLLLCYQLVMEPSCDHIGGGRFQHKEEDEQKRWRRNGDSSLTLRVMVVADMHLAGPRTAWLDRVRRETFMKSTLAKAYRKLKPDALVVLGDVSDAGRKSNDAQWKAVVARFWRLVRPFYATPIQVVVGNHDVGDHDDPGFSARLPRFAASFPGLDAVCGSHFSWKGVDFISLNAMAMHGDGCSVCSSVDRIVESTSFSLHGHHKERAHDLVQPKPVESHGGDQADSSGSTGPILLLHLPMYRHDDSACLDIPRCAPWHDLEGTCLGVASSPPSVVPEEEPHRVGVDVLSEKSSAHLLQSLKPRLVFSGHTHRWCDRIHANRTREITVPSLSWRNRDDPSFVVATFHGNNSIRIQRCMLAHESTVILIYILLGVTIFFWTLTITFWACNGLRSKSVKFE